MAGTFVLKPYERRRTPGALKRLVAYLGLILLAAFYGLMASVLPLQLIAIPVLPIVVLVALILWMLPDIGGFYEKSMARFSLWFIACHALWPWYIAVALPGLFMVTLTRMALGLLALVFLFNVATSAELRGLIAERLAVSPWLRRVIIAFTATTIIALPFSSQFGLSLTATLNLMFSGTMLLLVAAVLGTRPDFLRAAAQIWVFTAIMLGLLGLLEAKLEHVFWMDHLPSFLNIDAATLEKLSDSQARAGTDQYRVRGTMGVSLYFGQYLSLVLPMVIHFIVTAKGNRDRFLLLLGAIAIAAAMIQTGSRGAVIGLLLTLSVYTFFAFYRARRFNPFSLIAATGFFAYPVGAAAMIVLVFAWGRLRGMVIGNGSQDASDDGRAQQWDMGIPKVVTHPLGHGANRSGEVVGWTNPGGEASIDSLYLSMLVDFGPIGFVVFLLLTLIPAYLGVRIFINTRDSEASLVGPLAVGLINFTVYATVLSSLLQWPIVSIFIGLIIGTYWRTREDGVSKVPGKAALSPHPSPKLAKLRHSQPA